MKSIQVGVTLCVLCAGCCNCHPGAISETPMPPGRHVFNIVDYETGEPIGAKVTIQRSSFDNHGWEVQFDREGYQSVAQGLYNKNNEYTIELVNWEAQVNGTAKRWTEK